MTATFQIAPASDSNAPAGTSDLIITWQQRNPLTRKNQGGFTLAYDQPLGFNDLFYINLRQSFGRCSVGQGRTRGHTVHYGLHWGYWYLELTHAQEAHDYSSLPDRLDLRSGCSASSEAKLSRLLYRDAQRKTTLSFKGFRRSSHSGYKNLEISSHIHQHALGGWGSSLAHREFIGRAILDASCSYQRGTGALGAQAVPEDLHEGTPRFKVINIELSLKLPVQIAQLACHYHGSWNGEKNNVKIDNHGLIEGEAIDGCANTINPGRLSGHQIKLQVQQFNNYETLHANGNLSLTMRGELNNYGTLRSLQQLTIQANFIQNHANGVINATHTRVLASEGNEGKINNRGLIDGQTTEVRAHSLNNISTGRLYGYRW